MDPRTPSTRQDPPVRQLDNNNSVNDAAESASVSGVLPLRLRTNSRSTNSQQPSPLSQSTSAAETVAGPDSMASDVQMVPHQLDKDPSITAEQDVHASHDAAAVVSRSPGEGKKPGTGSMAALMQGREPDLIPGSISPDLSGNNSPDARLEKDYYKEKTSKSVTELGNDKKHSSDDEESGSRGRQKSREKKHYRRESNVSASDTDGASANEHSASEIKKPPRKLKTFEPLREKEERAKAASEPTVTITGPGGEKITIKKGPVHPNTNYDRAASRGASPNLSDSEELRDIKHAQSLAIWTSPIDNSTPQRVIRTILRGDYRGILEQAKAKKRKLRTYFVATDISEEAAYALEWTIGTVLRDGDTLLAIYAVNEETGTGKTGDPERIEGLELSEGAIAMRDTTATMERMTSEAPQSPVSPPGSALAAIGFGNRARRDSDRSSKDSRARAKGDTERLHAIDVISETCINFLRKTKLQVRVTVEVISCKSPRHMITEAVSRYDPCMAASG